MTDCTIKWPGQKKLNKEINKHNPTNKRTFYQQVVEREAVHVGQCGKFLILHLGHEKKEIQFCILHFLINVTNIFIYHVSYVKSNKPYEYSSAL